MQKREQRKESSRRVTLGVKVRKRWEENKKDAGVKEKESRRKRMGHE